METTAAGSGANLLEAGRRLQAHTTSAGGKLPAIRVHEQTHKIRGGPGLRLHGSELAAKLKDYLIAKGYNLEELSRKQGTRASQLALAPKEKTFGRQLAVIAKRVAPGLDAKTAVKTKTKEVIGELYRTASDQSLTGVELAVKASVIDGPADQKSTKLAELRANAKKVWEDHCLEPILK